MNHTIDQATFRQLLVKHKLWTDGAGAGCQLVLKDVNLAGVHLRGAFMMQATLFNVSFAAADLRECNLSHAHIEGSSFEAAHLTDALLHESSITGTCFNRADLTGVDLDGSIVNVCEFNESILDRGSLIKTELWRSECKGGSLRGVRAERVSFFKCDFRYANFTKANLSFATLKEVDMSHSTVEGAVIHGAFFVNCRLAHLQGRIADAQGVRTESNDWGENGGGPRTDGFDRPQ